MLNNTVSDTKPRTDRTLKDLQELSSIKMLLQCRSNAGSQCKLDIRSIRSHRR